MLNIKTVLLLILLYYKTIIQIKFNAEQFIILYFTGKLFNTDLITKMSF